MLLVAVVAVGLAVLVTVPPLGVLLLILGVPAGAWT
jgi:hypothetical protein